MNIVWALYFYSTVSHLFELLGKSARSPKANTTAFMTHNVAKLLKLLRILLQPKN